MPRLDWKRLALWVYGVGATIATVYYLLQAVPAMVEAFKQYPWDGKVDWIAARAYWNHVDPYSRAELIRVKLDGLGHPPTTSFWMLPIALRFEMLQISPQVDLIIIFCVLVMLSMLAYELKWPLAPLTSFLVFAWLFAQGFMYYHLYLVQWSAFISFLMFLAWYFLRRDLDIPAGAMLGFACTFKFFPGLLVLLLLLARRYRAVAAACVSYLAIAIFMTARFGWRSWPEYFESEKIIRDYWIGNYHNASVFGVALRLFNPACHGAAISQERATRLSLFIGIILFTIALRLAWPALKQRRWDLPFALFVVLSVFLNPFTFEHYFALLIFPMALALTALVRAWRTGLGWPERIVAVALAAGAFYTMTIPYRLKDDTPYWGHHHMRHWLEIANWLHMPLLLGLIGLLLYYENRRGGISLIPQATGAGARS